MRKILKALGFGIVLGTAAFFIPYIFKFIFSVIIIGFVLRMIFRSRRRRYFPNHFDAHENYYSPIVPIDNQWYKTNVRGNSTVQNINVNY